jgi:iron(III) transport system permease protein
LSLNPASSVHPSLGPPAQGQEPRVRQCASSRHRVLAMGWAFAGLLACTLLPWGGDSGMGLARAMRWDNAAGPLLFMLPFAVAAMAMSRAGAAAFAAVLRLAGGLGLFALFMAGWGVFGPATSLGLGAGLYAIAAMAWLCIGLAQAGRFSGDAFVAGVVLTSVALLLLFTVVPTGVMLANGFGGDGGPSELHRFVQRVATARLWGLGCGSFTGLFPGQGCGVVWNTLFLGLVTATLCTVFGLALALMLTRTRSRWNSWVRLAALLPMVTPPFVVGMGFILLFGRSGLVNSGLEWAFGIEPTRWIYGMRGVILAEVFAFTPVAFIVLITVVEGVSPTLEEAAQTLRAGRWRTFMDVSLPLMRPGLASAFMITFVETLADFGNPLILGANTSVLATEIFFAIVGADVDPGRAAVYSAILLAFTLAAFLLQRVALGRASYTTVSGKGDSGLPAALPTAVRRACTAIGVGWALFTLGLFALILVGGFVVSWGRNYTPTLEHFVGAFGMEWGSQGSLRLTGTAWESLKETLLIGAVIAPVTALLGVITAWVIARHDFRGKRAFEFSTLLSLAVPGTVTGVAYLLCFNAPPLELTGTAAIIGLCLLFRNLPVAVQAGSAAMAQLDKTLDEASTTLGARSFYTFRKVDLPLLRPVLVGTLMYGFVRAATSISAVIFLVSADHEMATTFIVGRIMNGDYGVAVAYSTVLIALSIAALGLVRLLVGERQVARRTATAGVAVLGGAG